MLKGMMFQTLVFLVLIGFVRCQFGEYAYSSTCSINCTSAVGTININYGAYFQGSIYAINITNPTSCKIDYIYIPTPSCLFVSEASSSCISNYTVLDFNKTVNVQNGNSMTNYNHGLWDSCSNSFHINTTAKDIFKFGLLKNWYIGENCYPINIIFNQSAGYVVNQIAIYSNGVCNLCNGYVPNTCLGVPYINITTTGTTGSGGTTRSTGTTKTTRTTGSTGTSRTSGSTGTSGTSRTTGTTRTTVSTGSTGTTVTSRTSGTTVTTRSTGTTGTTMTTVTSGSTGTTSPLGHNPVVAMAGFYSTIGLGISVGLVLLVAWIICGGRTKRRFKRMISREND